MAFYRRLANVFFIATLFLACNDKKSPSSGNASYDLLKPFVIKLPGGLAEISGIVFYPKDSSVFAIEDEAGVLYKIYLNNNNEIKKWKFDKKQDFEDLILRDSIFYVLISNGDIEALKFGTGDSITSNKFSFPNGNIMTNEFESLYYDDSLQQFVLLCKDCEDDNKKTVSAWGYDTTTHLYSPSVFTFDVEQLSQKIGEQKIKLKPSATAINPVTNELYILSSINHLLIVTDRVGRLKEVFELDPAIYKQAEGMAFTPAGDLIISNESHETGLANILIIKNKKKGL